MNKILIPQYAEISHQMSRSRKAKYYDILRIDELFVTVPADIGDGLAQIKKRDRIIHRSDAVIKHARVKSERVHADRNRFRASRTSP